MRYLLLCLVISISLINVNAQTFSWAKRTGASASTVTTPNWDRSLSIDGSGNVYTISPFNGVVDFDPGAGVLTMNSSNGSYAIQKFDVAGNLVWARQFHIGLKSIAVDGNGNICLTGNFTGTADFDQGAGIYNLTSVGAEDVFILKLTTDGNFLWAKQVGGPFMESAGYITISNSGNIYVSGRFYFNAAGTDFDPDPSVSNNLISAGRFDGFLLALNGDGTFLWVIQRGSVADEGLDQLTTDVNGNIIFTGTLNGNWILEKVDPSQNSLWNKNLGQALQIFSLATDPGGNVLASGNFSGTNDFDPGSGVKSFTASTNQDGFNEKFDANGNFLWAIHLRASGTANSIASDAAGNVYISGHFGGNGNIDFDPGPGTFNVKGTTRAMYIQKLNASGNFIWVKQVGGDTKSRTFARGIALGSNGDIYTNFEFYGTIDVDPGTAKVSFTSFASLNSWDKVIHKMTQPNNGSREAYVETTVPKNELSFSSISIKGRPALQIMNTYPNPNRGSFYVEVPPVGENARLVIYDMSGKIIFSKIFNGNTEQKIQVNLSAKSSGNYIVEVKGTLNTFKTKVNVQ